MKKILYILISVALVSCKQDFSIQIPVNENVNLLELDQENSDGFSVAVIGEFSGALNIRTIYVNGEDELVRHFNGTLVGVDEKTNGAYFVIPPEKGVKKINVYFWINEESYEKTILLRNIIIRDGNREIRIDKDNLEEYFGFKNITLNKETGELRPVNPRPIPEIFLKSTLQEIYGADVDSLEVLK